MSPIKSIENTKINIVNGIVFVLINGFEADTCLSYTNNKSFSMLPKGNF